MALSSRTKEELRDFVREKIILLGGPLEFLKWLSLTKAQEDFLLGEFKIFQLKVYSDSIADSTLARNRLNEDIP